MEGIDLGPLNAYIPTFLYVLLRTSMFMAFMPLFGQSTFPVQFKVGVVLALSMVLTPIVNFQSSGQPIAMIVMREVAFGLAMGAATRFVFEAVNVAGQLIATAKGLRAGEVFDPEFGQSGEISQLLGAMATLQFFAMNGHHDLLYVFVRSYDLVPAGGAELKGVAAQIIPLGSRVIALGFKLAVPVIVATFMVNIAMAFIGKAAPQLNIMMTSFPVFILVGVFVLYLSTPVFMTIMEGQFLDVREEYMKVLMIAAGR